MTGSSVLGIVYKDGVMIMADTLGSYGSMARFRGLQRIRKITDTTLIGAGGEYSDFQEIMHILKDLTIRFAYSTFARPIPHLIDGCVYRSGIGRTTMATFLAAPRCSTI